MHKTLLIFRHEFLRTIRGMGFIILTLALPVLALLGIGITHITAGIAKPTAEVTKIGYIDQVGGFDQFTGQGNISLVIYASTESSTQAMTEGDIKEYFVIPPDYATQGTVLRYTLEKQLFPPAAVTAAIKDFLSENLLAGAVSELTIKVIEAPLNVITTRLKPGGAVSPDQGGLQNMVVPGVFGLLLALSLIISSQNVLQGLGEEKENRLMEVLLSSISTQQLISGKVLGIGVAGLSQVLVWAVSIPLLLRLASSSIGGFLASIHVSAGFLILSVVYFVLGYLLFAVLASAVAAISSTVREGAGIASIFTLFAVAPFWFLSLLMTFPNSPVWVVFSIFPFSAPILVILRLGMFGVPAWQIAVSIAVMVLSIVAGLFIAGRLLRTYLLMYGKRPGLGVIMRNLKSG